MIQKAQSQSLPCPHHPHRNSWGRKTFELSSPLLWPDSELACPRAKALSKASAWSSAPAAATQWPQLAPGPASSPPSLHCLPFPPARGGGALFLQPRLESSRAGQTLQLCSWGWGGGRTASSVWWGIGGETCHPGWRASPTAWLLGRGPWHLDSWESREEQLGKPEVSARARWLSSQPRNLPASPTPDGVLPFGSRR